MSLITDALPGLLSTIGAAAVIAFASAVRRRMSSTHLRAPQRTGPGAALAHTRVLRRYTLLRTAGPEGVSGQYETTRPAGTVIVHRVNGSPQRFELTDVPLGDGTFAAEPLDAL